MAEAKVQQLLRQWQYSLYFQRATITPTRGGKAIIEVFDQDVTSIRAFAALTSPEEQSIPDLNTFINIQGLLGTMEPPSLLCSFRVGEKLVAVTVALVSAAYNPEKKLTILQVKSIPGIQPIPALGLDCETEICDFRGHVDRVSILAALLQVGIEYVMTSSGNYLVTAYPPVDGAFPIGQQVGVTSYTFHVTFAGKKAAKDCVKDIMVAASGTKTLPFAVDLNEVVSVYVSATTGKENIKLLPSNTVRLYGPVKDE